MGLLNEELDKALLEEKIAFCP